MSSSEKANLLATNVIAEQGSGVKTYRWVRAGTVMIATGLDPNFHAPWSRFSITPSE